MRGRALQTTARSESHVKELALYSASNKDPLQDFCHKMHVDFMKTLDSLSEYYCVDSGELFTG